MSKRIHLAPFKKDHIALFVPRALESEIIDFAGMSERLASSKGKFMSLIFDGRVIAIMGAYELWEGVYECFVIPSKYVCEVPLGFIRTVKRELDGFLDEWEMHRLQTASVADAQTDKWMALLGFKCEGTLERYMSNKLDYRMWARIVG